MIFFVSIILLIFVNIIYKRLVHSNVNSANKFVLITGCDSGFGYALAHELDREGFHVLASVFDQSNVELLKSKLSEKAFVFRLDITHEKAIDEIFDVIKQKTSVLHALVNNAGIATGGYIDWTTMDTMRNLMNVNFFGHVAMTKRFLPLLIAKKDSRVVNVCSMCGFLALPGSGAYCASKYALESFSDCLRREMSPWKLRVSVIEPGTIRTTLTESMKIVLKKAWEQTPTDVKQRWGNAFFDRTYNFIMNSIFMRYAENPDKVVQVLKHAVASKQPQIRYKPGWQSAFVFYPLSLLPAGLVDYMFSLVLSSLPVGVEKQAKK